MINFRDVSIVLCNHPHCLQYPHSCFFPALPWSLSETTFTGLFLALHGIQTGPWEKKSTFAPGVASGMLVPIELCSQVVCVTESITYINNITLDQSPGGQYSSFLHVLLA